ncbi:hypothetical protein [Yoonia litorea]|uniref:Uncharacterized protein n=1 Tax=Yoonia litorea TaxID=1123755 RepID=A0A1I6M3C1_9RHOB|nr:hypothetical protein [Yoonia litorea]SFS10176.1 hypothetical protein SAMN05444714_1187 [Yoonia litorea]
MRLAFAVILSALPWQALAQEVVAETSVDGRAAVLYADGTWEYSQEASGNCQTVARNVEFCGEGLGWESTLPPNADVAATYRYDDRHYGQMIIEELGIKDGLTEDMMLNTVIENAALVIGGSRADIEVMETYWTRVSNQSIRTIVYAFEIDGLDVVYANGIRTSANRTMQLMTFSIGTQYTDRHRDLHAAFLSHIAIVK